MQHSYMYILWFLIKLYYNAAEKLNIAKIDSECDDICIRLQGIQIQGEHLSVLLSFQQSFYGSVDHEKTL